MKRIAIILEKNLDIGKVANTSAILMGQASLLLPEIYTPELVNDKDGVIHASIQYSTIILKAGQGQIINLINDSKSEETEIICVVFTKIGQGLHNSFEEYKKQIRLSTTVESNPVGVLLAGEEEKVKALTKKFSLLV
jgi:hypothetical protein